MVKVIGFKQEATFSYGRRLSAGSLRWRFPDSRPRNIARPKVTAIGRGSGFPRNQFQN
jgi:hypothetical protein